jgi:hypothetical protein
MAQTLKSALPAHLKLSGLGNGDANAEFARKHHGKTQSHMVSCSYFDCWIELAWQDGHYQSAMDFFELLAKLEKSLEVK